MNRFNNADFNPHNVSIPSNDFFSFLDNEIYYIGALEKSNCSRFIKKSDQSNIFTFSEEERTKFLFRWKETGYVICLASDPSMVLTLKMENEPGKFHIETERYQNRADQIWEILPLELPSEPYALSIRSALKQSGEYIYIGWDGMFINAVRGKQTNASLMLCPLSEWVTFGMACMQYLEWVYVTDEDVKKALKNYYSNVMTNITAENALLYNNTGLIVNQSGGNFSSLNYADAYMNDVACEVIAVCNAIRLCTGDFDEYNTDFFKLSAEFELSGLYMNSFKKMIVSTGTALGIKRLSSISTNAGSWGGDPDKIGFCLEAHNITFTKIHVKDQPGISKSKKSEAAMKMMEKEISDSLCAVVSYNFDTLHQAIHTFTCVYENDHIQTFNRFCNYTPQGNYANPGLTDIKKGIFKTVTESVTSEKDAWFYVGYIINK